MNKFHGIVKILLACFFLAASFDIKPNQAHAFTDQVIQKGAVGDDVIELQARLQYIGFYNGDIDGVFGWRTYWAVRNFQYEFGLEVDGLVGQKMKDMLVKATEYDEHYVKKHLNRGDTPRHYGGQPRDETQVKKNQKNRQSKQNQHAKRGQQGQQRKQTKQRQQIQQKQPNQAQQQQRQMPNIQQAVNTPKGFSENDIKLMSNAVYGEARGEPYIGQVAVAAVIINRLNSASFPNDVAGVIFEPRAFTAVADGQIWLQPNETARKAVLDAINGWDPTGGSTYYFNPDTATSGWIWTRPQVIQIGKHIFAH